MTTSSSRQFTAPVFLGMAFLLFGVAILEKLLNLFGASIPIVDVFPRQVLEWAVTLLVFEIALMLRQIIEILLENRREAAAVTDRQHPH
jgi:hypothetical protein